MTTWRRTLLLLGCCLLAASSSLAQAPLAPLDTRQLASIDEFIKHEMARQRVPGLELGIYSRGRILLSKGYGLASVELNVPVKADTVMQAGSVGKQFGLRRGHDAGGEGKISLDDSITKYFPDAPAAWRPILIKNLLSHTSGLSEYEAP